MRYFWKFHQFEPVAVEELASRLGVSSLMARCLWNREVRSVEEGESFLAPFLKKLGDPFLVPDMEKAVERLLLARELNEPITIFGDYDVDGITAAAILNEFFLRLGWNFQGCYLPIRMEEGYGLSQEGIDHCMEGYPETRVLLAVDCGSTSAEGIERLQKSGLDVIVIDHHQIDHAEKPCPQALVNPRNVPEGQPVERELAELQSLCSAGLAFKLAHAILKRARDRDEEWAREFDLKEVLDLVALGTIADLVKLKGENRIFVEHGLRRINQAPRLGLQELLRSSRRSLVLVDDVSFYLAPRLNAAGRLEDAQVALELLTTTEPALAFRLAQQLEQVNQERKGLQNRIAEEVISRVRRNFDPEKDFVIVEGSFDWHIGVIGIAAAQVAKQFRRPVVILGGNGHTWRGSCRSVEGFDMAEALRQCEGLLLKHGGHSMAAGVELELNQLENFRQCLNKAAHKALGTETIKPNLLLDAEVKFSDVTPERLKELFGLAPFGMGNPSLALVVRRARMARPWRKFGQMHRHLKLFLNDGGSEIVEGVIWNFEEPLPPEGPLDVAFEPTLDNFGGQEVVRLKILDWKESED
ncbi:MAG: single-stranded-DNA-specific exonuclease RecJ [Limisphaerales bacterium]|jgi:single-stranded-DNA-specific exonuclease|nr:single-stranded-DNA-specific exonuclease RecJ [Verrucomicrobiota bacterium]